MKSPASPLAKGETGDLISYWTTISHIRINVGASVYSLLVKIQYVL